ncbi:MAG: ATP-binding cassette domain-containing protein [Parvibaculaceae bacterium]|nr:ATP-binding cassette domain-containing protein [Parvibaculaceae bacterium]
MNMIAPATPLLDVRNLVVPHRKDGHAFNAVDDVSFSLQPGETLGLVGESGCGKSTLARAIMGLYPSSSGNISFKGADITTKGSSLFRPRRSRDITRGLQMVFQDPLLSLNPRATIGRIVEEPLIVNGVRNRAARRAKVGEMLTRVGLGPDVMDRLPHEFSGGQRQRIGIARALSLTPELIICDEPVSALDLSVQAQVLNLLNDLQVDLKLSYLFISHDIAVLRYMASRVIVMYLGKIVEAGPADVLWNAARHPYTKALIAAAPGDPTAGPRARPNKVTLGDIPSPVDRPHGCSFHTRCALRQSRCVETEPALRRVGPGHFVACHFA